MRKAMLLAVALTASTLATTRAEAAAWLIAGAGCVGDANNVAGDHDQQFGVSSDVDDRVGYDTDTRRNCSHGFDPNTFLYVARVTITRNNVAQNPRFYGLSIFGGPLSTAG